ncbi:hypothetical protein [Sediminibacillus massiliensis]|uniref:hypothetical protein n=1 Tax=Sediminibacillus massiliensis TaxID=1926277 RepID=UPI0009883B4A|nr:hypothetical protein [Sediminibacillus massiliensis]
MAEHVEAYYKSENDAESARAKLNTLNTNQILIEEIPDGTDTKLLVPFMGSGDMAASTTTGVPPVAPTQMDNKKKEADPKSLTHLIHFEVEEEDYEKALNVLRETGSYIDESTFN